jgi:chromosome segregation ATPase
VQKGSIQSTPSTPLTQFCGKIEQGHSFHHNEIRQGDLMQDAPNTDSKKNKDEDIEEQRSTQSTACKATDTAANAAKEAKSSFLDGFAAMRAVGEAAKRTEAARAQIQKLQEDLEKDHSEFERRSRVEHDYTKIVEVRSTEIAAATKAAEAASKRAEQARAKHKSLSEELNKTKSANEAELSPYRQLMEATKGRADDASRALAEARRALKVAEGQATDAVKHRDQRIAGANRSLDSAQDRLRKVQSELDRLQKNPASSITAISKMRSEVAAEHAHIDSAKQEIKTVSADAQRAVDNAQTHLWAQKQSLTSAEELADSTKKEANSKKDEFDRLYKKTQAAEEALGQKLSECEAAAKKAEADLQVATDKQAQSQAALDDAHQIHASPQITENLRQRIEKTQASLAQQNAEADKISAHEQALRQSTRKQRLIFIALVVAILILIVLIVFFTTR